MESDERISDSSDIENVDESTTCSYCSENFKGVDRDNRPVMNPCGCILHWYCRYKRSHYSKDSICVSCPGCGAPKCSNCIKIRSEVKKLNLQIAKLKLTVVAQQQTINKLSKQSSK